MHIAVRWMGWSGVVIAAAGVLALLGVSGVSGVTGVTGVSGVTGVTGVSPWSQPEAAFSTTMTYRGYVLGLDRETLAGVNELERRADDEAFAGCLDAWPGKLSIREIAELPGIRVVHVEEHSPLDECLQLRRERDFRFWPQGVWKGQPANVTLNVPRHRGVSRDLILDELR